MKSSPPLVVITGVTKGLGRAMVDRFAERGWRVAGCGRSIGKIEELQGKFGTYHDFQQVDVTNVLSVEAWAKRVIELFGVPDLLINNASIVNQNAPLWMISPEEFADVMNVNLLGAVNVIRSFVPAMIARKKGTIVNISSSWGRNGEANLSPYCASKFAIEGLTQSLALELPEGIIAVTLDPGGAIDTEMLRLCAPKYVASSPSPEAWSRVAVPYILQIRPDDHGKALTCPTV